MRSFNALKGLADAVAPAVLVLLGSCGGGGGGTEALTITADSAPAGTAGTPYPQYVFTATGGTPPLTWTETGLLPPGLALSGAGLLTGNPGTAGSYPITVTVTDSSTPALRASAPVSLVISDSNIVITPASPPTGTATYVYPGFGFTASGGSPPYTWKASGALPPGLVMGTDGSVSGTPTTAGTFAFSVSATDSAQAPLTSPAFATQITIVTPGTLVLNAAPAPPSATGGSAYSFAFSTTGGYLPFTWSVTTGSLPPGITLDNTGTLNGTPAQTGTFNFTLTVKDSALPPQVSSQPFTIPVVSPPAPTIVSSEPPTGTVGAAYAFQFTANGGWPPLVWTESGALPAGLRLSPDGTLAGTPQAAGKFPLTPLDVTDKLGRMASVDTTVRISLARAASFTSVASMTVPRSGHSATLLNTGKVLIAGGANGSSDASAELYDPNAGTFAATGSMTEPRIGHTATLLANPALPRYGQVLIVGAAGTTAELYDPAVGAFTATGSLTHSRNSPTATLLQTGGAKLGMVLIVGGNTTAGDLTAELYNPSTGTFIDTGSTTVARVGHAAMQLLDGRVLIAGGGTASAELYDPVSGTFAPTGSMTSPRTGADATRLQDGTVLVFGSDGSADLYDPQAGAFAAVGSNPLGGSAETASLRSDGSVLAAGGFHFVYRYREQCSAYPFIQCNCLRAGPFRVSTSLAELFGPESGGFTATANALQTARDGHTATVLPSGAVLLAGGTNHTVTGGQSYPFWCRSQIPPHQNATVLSSAELFK